MRSVILLSGGIDSTVLLATRYSVGDEIIAVSFNYGQTHLRELAAARSIAHHYRVKHQIVSLANVFHGSALTGDTGIPTQHAEEPDATTVPGRNLVMISIGAAVAAAHQAPVVMFGANADDAAGYKDCRQKFVDAVSEATYTGTDSGVTVSAPLLRFTKRQIIDHGYRLDAPMHLTWSCYRGGEVHCGNCGACVSRIEAELEGELA